MKHQIIERLEALRTVMQREHIDAFIFPSTDPHNGEYVPPRWEGRKWISGFDGSAGTAVVTMKEAALWTDSRYFIAAAKQLEGTGFELMKERVEGTPTIARWLGRKLATTDNPHVALDGMVNSAAAVEDLTFQLRNEGGITLRTNFDPLDIIWKDRPQVPDGKIVIHPLKYAGESCHNKIKRIRQAIKAKKTNALFVAALDDIAWTLNLRGSDVHCNPVFVAYLLILPESVTLFTDSRKIDVSTAEYLKNEGVDIADYDFKTVSKALASYDGYSIMMDANEINHNLYHAVKCKHVDATSPIPAMKAIKNDVEVNGFRNAMRRDGVAMVKFLRWLKPAVANGNETEMSIDRKLTALRAEQPLFKGISFDTIAGYQEHGAIVHYEATETTDAKLKPEGLLLLDSGAQYEDGTTDITRTIALGPVTDEQKKIYTLVLKGHIQLEMCRFPRGASGTQIDALARMDIWKHGLNYMHGTGHGVGSFLCVHEGPHQIRMEYRPAPIVEGMTVTDEPGLYLEGRFGVRIENTLIAVPFMETEFGQFLKFESLTLCPIDLTPVIADMLSKEEKEWLNTYHTTVYDTLSPMLDGEDLEWLKANTIDCKLN